MLLIDVPSRAWVPGCVNAGRLDEVPDEIEYKWGLSVSGTGAGDILKKEEYVEDKSVV